LYSFTSFCSSGATYSSKYAEYHFLYFMIIFPSTSLKFMYVSASVSPLNSSDSAFFSQFSPVKNFQKLIFFTLDSFW
jgi:hypothetical protein